MSRSRTKPAAKPAPAKRKSYSAPALEKGLDILELLATEEDALGLSEIAAKLDRSIGEIFRMLVVLQQRGYLSVTNDSYALTLKLFELARKHLPIKRLSAVAAPIMQRLSATIEQSCHIVTYYKGRGLVVLQQDSPADRIFSVRLGAEAPLFSTCSGRVLLSFADPIMREYMLQEQPASARKGMSKKQVDQLVARVRSQGFERVMSAFTAAVEDIGYPIYDYLGRVQAALVVPFLGQLRSTSRGNPDQVQPHVAEAARRISEGLGYREHIAAAG